MESMDHMIPRNYTRPRPLAIREVPQIMEAVRLPSGEMSMRFHHFDARELPIVALNTERIFFLAQPLVVDGRNRFSTDLDKILA